MQKNIFKFLALLIVFVCAFYFFKKMQHTPEINSTELESQQIYKQSLPDDFHLFYDKFHTDSVFQMSRIIFPLKGLVKSTDTLYNAEEYLWQTDEWVLHKPFDAHNGTFDRVFTNIGGIVSERISANNGLFTLEKRYAKLDGEWHLIYYQELIMNG